MRYNDTVSVVITTRGRAEILPRAVRSALRQTHPPLEIIVVVDGPDESAVEALRRFQGHPDEPPVVVVALERRSGACAARNAGVDAARGDWVAFLDDDDEWHAEKLQAQLKMAAESRALYPIVSCRVLARTAQGVEFVWPRRRLGPAEHLSDYLLSRNTVVQGEGLIATSMILAPRRLLMQTRFDPALPRHQEWDWLLRATAQWDARVVIAWDALAVWHIEQPCETISGTGRWRRSFEWIASVRRLVTPRAYASFLLVFVSAIAAREGDYAAMKPILRAAQEHGRPAPIDYLLFAAMWLLPQPTRRKLRNALLPEAQTA